MPRQSDPIDDRTPLDAPQLDVAARVGWLLRTHRTVAGLSLRQMAELLVDHGVTLSAATLSRVESEGHRNPAVIDGYNAALGLPRHQLRAYIDGICRAFSYSPSDQATGPAPTLASFSEAYDAVTTSPTAGDWIAFARQHVPGQGFGLPSQLMRPLVEQLADETPRAVAASMWVRHEALNVLANSAYADLTIEVLRSAVEDPDHQAFFELASVLSDHPSPGLAAWAAGLMTHASSSHVRCGSFVLQGMLVHGGLPLEAWQGLAALFEEAWTASRDHPEKCLAVDQAVGALPRELRAELRRRGLAIPPRQSPVPLRRTRDNQHYSLATALARTVTLELGQADEPLLTRLLFEACFEPRGVRMSMAMWTLGASPFAARLARLLVAHDAWPDIDSRTAAARVAAVCNPGAPMPEAEQLLAGDAALFLAAVTIIGRSGGTLPDDALARGLAGDETAVRATVACLGMAGDPRLSALADDADVPTAVSRGARWWLERGPRVLE